jgi:hypothetical protein
VKYKVAISGRLYDKTSVTVPIEVSTVTEINFVPLSPIDANAKIAVSECHEILWCAVPPILQNTSQIKRFGFQLLDENYTHLAANVRSAIPKFAPTKLTVDLGRSPRPTRLLVLTEDNVGTL